MKTHTLLLLLIPALAVGGQSSRPPSSPAQRIIERAQKAIGKNPDRCEPYNELAMGLARRARETSNVDYYAQAEQALARSFEIAPDNFEGRKAQVWVLLGKHEFAAALKGAQALNRRMPDDVLVYGLLADANAELGNYQEAIEAVQWMLDMRPGNVPGLTRAAYLREMIGYLDGAVEFMNAAYQRTPPTETEDRSWILAQLAHLQLLTGKVEAAERLLSQALELFPGYHYALGNLAKVRAAQHRDAEAVDLLRERYRNAPHPENLYELAEALERVGREREAHAAFSEFEQKARAEMEKADNSNRELIFYYAGHARPPAEALRIARLEAERRHDVYTLDAYAWALYANGEYGEARKQIERALRVGVRDARLFYHAGAIATRLEDQEAAARYLRQSLDLNPVSEFARPATTLLASLQR